LCATCVAISDRSLPPLQQASGLFAGEYFCEKTGTAKYRSMKGPCMRQWEYLRLDLNDTPRRRDETTVLIRAGSDGWELVTITGRRLGRGLN
jgi:hypothetical protein